MRWITYSTRGMAPGRSDPDSNSAPGRVAREMAPRAAHTGYLPRSAESRGSFLWCNAPPRMRGASSNQFLALFLLASNPGMLCCSSEDRGALTSLSHRQPRDGKRPVDSWPGRAQRQGRRLEDKPHDGRPAYPRRLQAATLTGGPHGPPVRFVKSPGRESEAEYWARIGRDARIVAAAKVQRDCVLCPSRQSDSDTPRPARFQGRGALQLGSGSALEQVEDAVDKHAGMW